MVGCHQLPLIAATYRLRGHNERGPLGRLRKYLLFDTCPPPYALGYRNPAHQPQRLLRMHDLRNTACFERLDQSQAVCQLPLHCECSALTSHPLLGPPEEVHASMRTAVTTTRLL